MFDLGLKILRNEEKQNIESKIQDKVPVANPESTIWMNISNMHNTAFAVDMAAKKVVAIVTADREIRNAVSTLRSAKANINTYGASEAVMCIFNENNMLADVLGMSIPTITEDNAKAVGMACVENIDATVESAYDKVKEFFAAICEAAAKFFERFKAQAECQCATIGEVITNIIDKAEGIDDTELGKENVFGYTQPVFMERISALQFIIDNLAACGCTNEELRKFEPALKTLGYKVVEKNESDAAVAPETPAEQAADAPAPNEVMDPVQEPAENVSSEDVAPDAAQEKPMAVFRWTQATIKTSAESLKALLASANKFDGVATKLGEIRGNVMAAIEAIASAAGEEKAEKENIIECGRNYAAFVGDIIGVFGGSVSELVDQIVCMASKLNKQKADGNGQPANVGTEPAPANEPAATPPATEPTPSQEPEQTPSAPAPETNQDTPAPAPEGGEQPKEGEQPAEGAPAPEGGETPAQGKKNWWDDELQQPEGVPNDAPVSTPEGVDPNGEPEPGSAPHIVPTETPEGEQPEQKAEPFMEDVLGTRLF